MRKMIVLLMVLCLAVPVSAVPVPILMYHHFTAGETELPDQCSVEGFRVHLAALTDAGYTAVTFGDLLAYVRGTGDLPEKPVVLTSDDGYRSVIEIALPLLREYGMTMSVAVVGSRIGGAEGIPHFSLEEASGTGLELVSHTWNLHGPEGTGVLTENGVLHPGFAADTAKMRQIPEILQYVLVYPYGSCNEDSEAVAAALGYSITVTTREGIADICQGDEDSLRSLPRIGMGDGTDMPLAGQ